MARTLHGSSGTVLRIPIGLSVLEKIQLNHWHRSSFLMRRAALTGKHDTLVRRAPGWQGALDGQQAKKLVVRYDTRCYFNVRSKADISQLNLPHGTDY